MHLSRNILMILHISNQCTEDVKMLFRYRHRCFFICIKTSTKHILYTILHHASFFVDKRLNLKLPHVFCSVFCTSPSRHGMLVSRGRTTRDKLAPDLDLDCICLWGPCTESGRNRMRSCRIVHQPKSFKLLAQTLAVVCFGISPQIYQRVDLTLRILRNMHVHASILVESLHGRHLESRVNLECASPARSISPIPHQLQSICQAVVFTFQVACLLSLVVRLSTTSTERNAGNFQTAWST